MFDGAKRYDINEKKYFETPLKYYMVDVWMRNVCLNFRQIEENHIMENELKIHEYSVDVVKFKHILKYLKTDLRL